MRWVAFLALPLFFSLPVMAGGEPQKDCPPCEPPPRLNCQQLWDRIETRCPKGSRGECDVASCPECKTCPEPKHYATVTPVRETVVYEEAPHTGHWFIPLSVGYVRGTFGAAGIGYMWPNRISLAGQAIYGQINGLDGSVQCRNCTIPCPGETTHDWGGQVTVAIPLGR